MTVPLSAVYLFDAGCLTLACYWLFVDLPNTLRSLFKHKLWALRDAMMDDFLGDRIPASDEWVWLEWMRFLHVLIDIAHQLTAFRLACYVAILWRPIRRGARHGPSFGEFWNAPDEGLMWYEQRTAKLLGWHLLLGSPSGWLLAPVVALVFAAAYTVKRLKGHVQPQREVVQEAMNGLFPVITNMPRTAEKRAPAEPATVG